MTEFDKPGYFLNRELSWLKFNMRVLQEADDKANPLLEQLRFIAIFASNLDEFFMIRVAGLQQQLESGINKQDAAGLTVKQQLEEISRAVHAMVKTQYRYLRTILQELIKQEILVTDVESLSEKNKAWAEDYFLHTVYPVITPLAVDASHPFPFLANRSLNLAVMLGHERECMTAVVQVPAVLPRIIPIPGGGKKKKFILLEELIRSFCFHLFHGYILKDILAFRITRNSDLSIDEEESEDLLALVEKSLRQRKRGQGVRLELSKTANKNLKNFLIDALKIEGQDIYEINGPIDLTFLMKFVDLPEGDFLRYPAFVPQVPADLVEVDDLFAAIRERDILLHHPYESFEPVVELIRRAAADPDVLAIKQTLYRVSGNSPIVRALAQAAENGKQVTVLVELKARFDEERNILWARQLEEAGCHVIYGLVGLKTHAKILLVVRRESSGIKRYVHMGTGNYNDATARVYTDMGLFTANDQMGADASAFFNLLSGYSDPPVWNKIVVAPMGLRRKLEELIAREIEHVENGKTGRIIAKMNALVDKEIVLKLYEAAHKGVKIDLIIRGICILRPGLPEVSENVSVRSIVGRFLEHSRIFYFANGGDEKVYLSSADWMTRNLRERVELFFPVEDPRQAERIRGLLDLMLKDNQKAHIMKSDGTYRRADRRGRAGTNSQELFYEMAQLAAKPQDITLEQMLKPMYRKQE